MALIENKVSMKIAADELYQSSYPSAIKELFPDRRPKLCSLLAN